MTTVNMFDVLSSEDSCVVSSVKPKVKAKFAGYKCMKSDDVAKKEKAIRKMEDEWIDFYLFTPLVVILYHEVDKDYFHFGKFTEFYRFYEKLYECHRTHVSTKSVQDVINSIYLNQLGAKCSEDAKVWISHFDKSALYMLLKHGRALPSRLQFLSEYVCKDGRIFYDEKGLDAIIIDFRRGTNQGQEFLYLPYGTGKRINFGGVQARYHELTKMMNFYEESLKKFNVHEIFDICSIVYKKTTEIYEIIGQSYESDMKKNREDATDIERRIHKYLFCHQDNRNDELAMLLKFKDLKDLQSEFAYLLDQQEELQEILERVTSELDEILNEMEEKEKVSHLDDKELYPELGSA